MSIKRRIPIVAACAVMGMLLSACGPLAGDKTKAVKQPVARPEVAPETKTEIETRVKAKTKAAVERPRIEIAILLDTSSSMSGLIEQAKRQLWEIVNEFITANKKGVRPLMRVGLYEYGKSSLRGDEGYIRRIVPLSDNLDKVSEELFALKTNGGSEFCGWVIKRAVEELDWSKSKEDLKVIYIAGNEAFTQGKVDYRKSCKAAIARGIIVNTIHCGSRSGGVSGKWQAGAVLADGTYAVINQNHAVVAVTAPQDKKIAELGAKLNKTYVAYGAAGKAGAKLQAKNDTRYSGISTSSMAQRAVAKANSYYVNTGWDLIDAVNKKKVDLANVKDKELPANMRKMSLKGRREYVAEQGAARMKIQASINTLNTARKKYVTAEMKKRGEKAPKSLGSEMAKSLRAQAARQKFQF
jgi:von Willebrand factor type A domain